METLSFVIDDFDENGWITVGKHSASSIRVCTISVHVTVAFVSMTVRHLTTGTPTVATRGPSLNSPRSKCHVISQCDRPCGQNDRARADHWHITAAAGLLEHHNVINSSSCVLGNHRKGKRWIEMMIAGL